MPVLKLDGDATGAVKATADVNAEAKKLIPTFREVSDAADKAGQTHEKSFGGKAAGDLISYAARMASVGAAIGFVNAALRDQVAEKQRLAQLDETALVAAGRLSAVGGTAADLAQARELQKRGVVDTQVEGIRAVTAFRQQRLTGAEQEYVTDLANRMVIDPAQMGEYAAGVQTFRRAQGVRAGTFQTTERQIAAAGRLTRFSPEEIALTATRLAGPGAEAGLSQEEQLATLIVATNKARNLRTGGTAAEKMVTEGERFEGADAVEYANALRQIRQGGGERVGDTLMQTDQRLRSADAAADAKARLDEKMAEQTSTATNLYQRIYTRRKERVLEQYGTGVLGGIMTAVESTAGWLGQRAGIEESEIRYHAGLDPVSAREQGLSREDINDMKEFLRQQTEMMERGDRNPPPPNGRQQ